MVRTSKTTTPKETTPKKAATKKATKAVEPAPVVEAAPVNEVVQEVSSTEQKMSEFSAKLQQLSSIFSSLKADYKTLEKQVLKEARAMDKVNAKRNRNKGSRAPSGFAKPALISDELCSFLGKPPQTEMARTEVTKHLTTYIKEHQLQDQANKRKILPDAKLKKLLNLKASDEVTYFNLQKYMKVHFPKSAAATAATSS